MSKLIRVQIDNKTGIEMYLLFKRSGLKKKYLNFSPKEVVLSFWEIFNKEKSNLILAKNENKSFNFLMEVGHSGTLYISPRPLDKEHPCYKTSVFLFDQIKVSYKPEESTLRGYLGKWELSNSNFFGLPMQLKSGDKRIGFKDGITRAKMIKHFSEMNASYNTFRMPRSSKNVNRWLSPASKDPRNIWKEAISYGLKKLSGQDFEYEEDGRGITCFFKNGTNNSIEVREINTKDDFKVDRKFIIKNIDTFGSIRGTLFPENIKTKKGRKYIDGDYSILTIRSGALIAAAINRGVLYDTHLWEGKKKEDSKYSYNEYYKSNHENKGQFNLYSKILHDHYIRHQCFGFCYDHFFQEGSVIEVFENTERDKDGISDVEITLLPFK